MNPEIFRRAREVLLEKGWVQGDYHLPRGYCVIGACGQAMRDLGIGKGHQDFEFSPHFMMLRRAVDEIGGLTHGDREVYIWNDVRGRALDEVLAVLKRAEQIAREETLSCARP